MKLFFVWFVNEYVEAEYIFHIFSTTFGYVIRYILKPN